MYLFLAFLAVPVIEIALFIQVGGLIGLWPTLAIVVLTAMLGTWLVRTQGRVAMGQLQRAFSELDDPTEPLAHGAMILLAGALLLTPGFFTDAVGFALLMPPVRLAVFRYVRSRITVARFEMGSGMGTGRPPHRPGRDDVIDADYTEVKPEPRRPGQRPSGWVEGPDHH
ncbi:FxsA family protein [Antarcticimicrobium sediminis]|uniref:FxsA family protein n=1 Tax=Antarcticimicrobium sediminis TaxID=2546227 RepID=A0A4R5EQY2_9RHOB|nr:FxsA family protein [Antarcticimicrobium sediminis]TDE36993.1 FxsA family protein [Antarcticimicrobium sediminis]